jgi:hypothetical protein
MPSNLEVLDKWFILCPVSFSLDQLYQNGREWQPILDRIVVLFHTMIPQEGPTLVPNMGEHLSTNYIFRSDQAMVRMHPKHRSIGINLENSLLAMMDLGIETSTGFPKV